MSASDLTPAERFEAWLESEVARLDPRPTSISTADWYFAKLALAKFRELFQSECVNYGDNASR